MTGDFCLDKYVQLQSERKRGTWQGEERRLGNAFDGVTHSIYTVFLSLSV